MIEGRIVQRIDKELAAVEAAILAASDSDPTPGLKGSRRALIVLRAAIVEMTRTDLGEEC